MGHHKKVNSAPPHKKKLVGAADAKKPVMVALPKKEIKQTKNKYYGGADDEPHIHVYPSGCHLKLGKHRYNLVQDSQIYKGKIAEGYEALRIHALHDTLRPWMDAALVLFGAESEIPAT